MSYVVLEIAPELLDRLVEGVGGRVVASGDSLYGAALGVLQRCTLADLRQLELTDLRRVKEFVAGRPSPRPAPGPVGSRVAVVREGDRTEV